MRYNKTAIENTIEKIFGTEVDDAELLELLQKIIAHREIIKTAIKDSDYNKMRDCFLRLSVLNSELADRVALQQMIVGSLNAGFESEKENIYRDKIAEGSSASMAYQHSARLVKIAEADFIQQKSILASMITISESTRYLISDCKARLEYEKGEMIKNNISENSLSWHKPKPIPSEPKPSAIRVVENGNKPIPSTPKPIAPPNKNLQQIVYSGAKPSGQGEKLPIQPPPPRRNTND